MMLNILFLNYEYPPLGGGAGICTQAQAEGLSAIGHRVTVVTSFFEGEKEFEEKGHLRLIRLKTRRKFKHKSSVWEMLSWIRQSKRFLQSHCNKEAYDVCLANFTIPGGVVALMLKRQFKIPYVIISHGHDIPWFFPRQMFHYHLFLYPYIKYIADNAKRIVVLNNSLVRDACRLIYNKEKVVLIPNGFRRNSALPSVLPKQQTLTLLFIGRFVIQKDPLCFLKSLVKLQEKGIDFKAELIGDGPLRQKMETFAAQHKLREKVVFRGWISRQELEKLMAVAHVQVMTSLAEAMSIAAIEGLSAGLFLISTDTGNSKDLIVPEMNGLIVPKQNPLATCHGIEWYYENKFSVGYTVPEDLINGVCEKYNWDSIILQYNKMLEKLNPSV